MEAKLKSISNLIPWSLLLKAFLFGAGWLALPFWLFIIFSLYLYLVPFFQPLKLGVPFVITLLLASFIEPNGWLSIFFSIIFFFILGIKDLVFVDRQTAYTLLVFVLSFLSILFSFSRFDSGVGVESFIWLLVVGSILTLLLRSFLKYNLIKVDRRKRNTLLGFSLLLFLEAGLATLFLPANFFHQTAIVFFSFVVIFELLTDYLSERLTPKRGLIYFSLYFAAIAIILASIEFVI